MFLVDDKQETVMNKKACDDVSRKKTGFRIVRWIAMLLVSGFIYYASIASYGMWAIIGGFFALFVVINWREESNASVSPATNPATGLTMVGPVDSDGNPYGAPSHRSMSDVGESPYGYHRSE